MQKKVLMLVLYFLCSPLALSNAEHSHCPPRASQISDSQNWPAAYEAIKKSVFKVTAKDKNGIVKGIGTASLIELIGPSAYFLTASHIFEITELDFSMPGPFKWPVELYTEEYGFPMKLKGLEIFHRSRLEGSDLSIIQAEINPDQAALLLGARIDVILEASGNPEAVAMIGFPSSAWKAKYHYFFQIFPNERSINLRGTNAFPGESGSIAVTQNIKAIGVLKKRDDIDESTFEFTPTHEFNADILKIPQSVRVRNLLSAFETGESIDYRGAVLKTARLSNIETMHLTMAINASPQKYKYAENYIDDIARMCFCNHQDSNGLGFLRKHPFVSQASFKLDAGRTAWQKYSALRKIGTPADERKPYLVQAQNYFSDYEKDRTGLKAIKKANTFKSFFYIDYANILLEAKKEYPEIQVKDDQVAEKIQSAITTDKNNPVPYYLAKDVFWQNGYKEEAAWAAASAFSLASEKKSGVLDNEWKMFLSMAVNDEKTDDSRKTKLKKTLNKGISNSKKLVAEDFAVLR